MDNVGPHVCEASRCLGHDKAKNLLCKSLVNEKSENSYFSDFSSIL